MLYGRCLCLINATSPFHSLSPVVDVVIEMALLIGLFFLGKEWVGMLSMNTGGVPNCSSLNKAQPGCPSKHVHNSRT